MVDGAQGVLVRVGGHRADMLEIFIASACAKALVIERSPITKYRGIVAAV